MAANPASKHATEHVRCKFHPGSRGPRGRQAAAWHVHRVDGAEGSPPSRVGDRGQLHRRGARRALLGDPDRRPPGQLRLRHRRRSRAAGRHDEQVRQVGGRGHPHHAARRRQVRRPGLQGLRRPARRRRLGGQRARPSGWRSRSGARGTCGASATSAGFPKGKLTKDRKLKKGEGTGTTIKLHARPRGLHRDRRALVRHAEPALPRVCFPQQEPEDTAGR